MPYTVLINPQLEPVGATRWKKAGRVACPCRACAASCRATRACAIAASTSHGKPIDRTVSDFHARVVQHEVDHLNGILYPMRIRDLRNFGFNETLFPGQELQDE